MNGSHELLGRGFGTLTDLIAMHAREEGSRRALVTDSDVLTYTELDALMDRLAAGLQLDQIKQHATVAIVSDTTIATVAVFFGVLRAGCVPVPIAPSSTPEQIASMIADSKAALVFADSLAASLLPPIGTTTINIDYLKDWLPPEGASPLPVEIRPSDSFNIIYSSGTTGTPKGIVHTHLMRWAQTVAWATGGFASAVSIVATPIYSNTTLTTLLPTLAFGGTAVLLGKFDARRFVEVAERERATHTMLVPVQYQRIMALPDFDRFDLSSFQLKTCTSAPFASSLKADIIKRWSGELLEIYGMTEGGGNCLLHASQFPDKLHTVGHPAPGHDVRLIDATDREVAQGEIGEVVGRSSFMMAGYHGRHNATDAVAWYDADGNRFIRHGDLGRFDEDGFLTLLGRSKDMIISGGFNIYPADLEAVLLEHPDVADVAVIGIESEAWGETPFAYYVSRNERFQAAELVTWFNARIGKIQRLSGAQAIAELPRSTIGKVLKRELRAVYDAGRSEGPPVSHPT